MEKPVITIPLVSVIIPAFNAQDLIAETIDSILAQTYGNVEIIVVDDGSTDETSRIVRGYGPRVHYYHQSNSGGCAVPRNTGLKHCSGDFICFIDADDLMVPDRIACQVDFMERHPDVGLVFSDYRNFNENGPYATSHFRTCPRLWPLLQDRMELVLENACTYLAEENFGIAGSFMFRKSLLAFESGFETTLKSCEDFHFYYRLARHTPVGIINKIGIMRRLHENNMSGNSVRMLSEGIRSRTLLRESEKELGARSLLNRYIADCQSSLARFYADSGQYIKALKKDGQALSFCFCWHQVMSTSRSIGRTILMALGVYKPHKSSN
jgi:glycosyltransferase involved in cell wall biosynthesis